MSCLAAVEEFARSNELPLAIDAEKVVFQLSGTKRLTTQVVASHHKLGLRLESFFMRKPLENADAFCELLMRRNLASKGVCFAMDSDGDAYLVAWIPKESVSASELDRVAGAILIESDGMFEPAMRIGFASYLAADMAWREKIARAEDE